MSVERMQGIMSVQSAVLGMQSVLNKGWFLLLFQRGSAGPGFPGLSVLHVECPYTAGPFSTQSHTGTSHEVLSSDRLLKHFAGAFPSKSGLSKINAIWTDVLSLCCYASLGFAWLGGKSARASVSMLAEEILGL